MNKQYDAIWCLIKWSCATNFAHLSIYLSIYITIVYFIRSVYSYSLYLYAVRFSYTENIQNESCIHFIDLSQLVAMTLKMYNVHSLLFTIEYGKVYPISTKFKCPKIIMSWWKKKQATRCNGYNKRSLN